MHGEGHGMENKKSMDAYKMPRCTAYAHLWIPRSLIIRRDQKEVARAIGGTAAQGM
jgi:hypothetical protein